MRVKRYSLQERLSARPPQGAVIYAMGDIHGRADLFFSLHEAIAEDALQRANVRKVIVYLGDYSSRGPDTRKVLDALTRAPLPGFEAICLKGNHEDLILRLLDGDDDAGRHWLAYGGRETLASYGISAPGTESVSKEELDRLRRQLSEQLPPAHLAFLRSLPISHREGDYVFVHAGIRPGVPIAQQTTRDMLWIRKRFLESNDDFGAVIVHGHSTSEEPVIRRNRIGIDTGAHTTNRLTAIVLEEARCAVLQTVMDGCASR